MWEEIDQVEMSKMLFSQDLKPVIAINGTKYHCQNSGKQVLKEVLGWTKLGTWAITYYRWVENKA